MNQLLTIEFAAKREAIVSLCERHGVASLDLFGSAMSDDWSPVDSDLDFVVVFRPGNARGIADRYLGLAEDLEALFGRRVDLITPAAIRNPYFRERVDATRSHIYAD